MNLRRKSSKVISSHCSCPAGNSGYCSHIMAMAIDFCSLGISMHKQKQWGVLGEKNYRKAPIMETIIQKYENLRGITCMLYYPEEKGSNSPQKIWIGLRRE